MGVNIFGFFYFVLIVERVVFCFVGGFGFFCSLVEVVDGLIDFVVYVVF